MSDVRNGSNIEFYYNGNLLDAELFQLRTYSESTDIKKTLFTNEERKTM